MTLQLS